MKYLAICNYCDNREINTSYYKPKSVTCPKCKDPNVIIREFEYTNVFGYSEDELKAFKEAEDKRSFDDMYDLMTGAD